MYEWKHSGKGSITGVIRHLARALLAGIIALALFGFPPPAAMAEENPVDLELGGEGTTPWNISNARPSDSGNKTVELHNVGSQDGFVSVWISDIVSNEGTNPESETGNIGEPGEFANYLTLDLACTGLTTNLNLPVTIQNLPQSFADSNFIEIIPLKTGETVDLELQWELPPEAGNDMQGDNISFTINYLLREMAITDVSTVVTGEGVFTEKVVVESETGKGELCITENITAQTAEGDAPTELWLIEVDKEPTAPQQNAAAIALFDAGPDGTTFDQPITITFSYNDPDDIPQGTDEEDLFIALWDSGTGTWVELANSTVDTANDTVSAPVSHFSRYTIIAPLPPPLPPPEPDMENYLPKAITVDKDVSITSRLEVDMLGKADSITIGEDGIVPVPFTITDPDSRFVIAIGEGTRITGPDNTILSRIELSITEEPIAIPQDTIGLSPIYKLTGYVENIEVARINFDPPVRLTINYDPEDLPENTFLPFIATYTDEQGLVRLEPPPGSTIEVGRAEALISHASLFLVVAEVAPPPPPLPARFEVENLTVSPLESQLGQPITVSVTVTNDGEIEGNLKLHLIIDGIVRMIKEVTLAGKSSETLTFEVSNLAVGKHQVKLSGLTEQFSVVRMEVIPEESGVNWFIFDMSVGIALTIGALVLFLVIRKSRRTQLERPGGDQEEPSSNDS